MLCHGLLTQCQHHGLVAGATGERSITEQGFQFLLLDTYGQLWLLLREYIASANARFGASLRPCLLDHLDISSKPCSNLTGT